MPQMAEVTMARADRSQQRVDGKALSVRNHGGAAAAAAAVTGALSPPMMSKAQVVYYLCRGGKIEPPHMIEVPHCHYDGLRLRDVKHRLTILRGGGMPNMFSWSCKRMYKNTHIWQDVCDDDSLTPASGGEYVLKGSEFFVESNTQEKPLKPGSNQDVLQRKFRGAETWLKASSGTVSPKLDYATGGGILVPDKAAAAAAENCHSVSVQAVTNQLRNFGLDHQLHHQQHNNGKRQPPEASSGSDDYTSSKRSGSGGGGGGGSGGFAHEEPGMHDIKVCEVSRPQHAPMQSIDHGCSVATQTDVDNGNGYVYCQSSGSSTPTCFGNDIRRPPHPDQQHGAPASKDLPGKLKRRFGRHQAEAKQAGPKVKMKQSAASCVFLHILSYCGGVDTKTQRRSSPPTESTPSEYSFDGGICRAESKMPEDRSPQQQYSPMDVHTHQYHQGMMQDSNNRSGPLIPYSSEYFDVKETVSPLQSSPLQAARSSKGVSSNLDEDVVVLRTREEAEAVTSASDPKMDGEDDEEEEGGGGGGDVLLNGAALPEAESECLWSRSISTSHDQNVRGMAGAAAAANLRPWNRNLRLSKRRFFRHWWQAMFESLQAKALLRRTRIRTWPRDDRQCKQMSGGGGGTKHFFVGKCRRSRTRSFGRERSS